MHKHRVCSRLRSHFPRYSGIFPVRLGVHSVEELVRPKDERGLSLPHNRVQWIQPEPRHACLRKPRSQHLMIHYYQTSRLRLSTSSPKGQLHQLRLKLQARRYRQVFKSTPSQSQFRKYATHTLSCHGLRPLARKPEGYSITVSKII